MKAENFHRSVTARLKAQSAKLSTRNPRVDDGSSLILAADICEVHRLVSLFTERLLTEKRKSTVCGLRLIVLGIEMSNKQVSLFL